MGNLRHSNRSRIQHFLLGLALFALLFRVAVPPGMMPHLYGNGTDTPTVVLCSAHNDLAQAAAYESVPHAPADEAAEHLCPFCALVSQAFLPATTTLVPAPAPVPSLILTLRDWATLWPTLRAGPPLGPRAPPAYLG